MHISSGPAFVAFMLPGSPMENEVGFRVLSNG